MNSKKLLLMLIITLICGVLQSQTFYSGYQDGKIIFQLKTSEKPIPSKNRVVDYRNQPFFQEYLTDFSMDKVTQLFPTVPNDEKLLRTYQIDLLDFYAVDQFIRELNKNQKVEYAELKALHKTSLTPNDPYFQQFQWGEQIINAQQAWDMATGSTNVTVAITDDAIDIDHTEFEGQIVSPWNATDNNNNPRPSCGSNSSIGNHGTHTTGTVGAKKNNNVGIASVASGVLLMPIKIGDCSDYLPNAYEGVQYAAQNGADIISCSWGGSNGGNYEVNILNYARNQGSIVVVAAGNSNTSNTTNAYPAARSPQYENMVAVAASASNDTKASFSNYGSYVDITTPGVNIYSTLPNNSYGQMSGTSMATPMTSSALALMKSYAPGATNEQLLQCLFSSADPMPNASQYANNQLGAGRTNVYAALQCLTQYIYSDDAAISDIIEPIGMYCKASIEPKFVLKNLGANNITSATIAYNWGGDSQIYNWSGNLATGESVIITLPTQILTDGNYTFTASIVNIGPGNDENPSNDSMSSDFIIANNGQDVTLYINTDCWGSETTWEVVDENDNLLISGGPYSDIAGGASNIENFCLPLGCYSFKIYDTYGDGMYGSQWSSCNINGNYYMQSGDGTTLFEMTAQNADFGSSTSHPFCVTLPAENDAGINSISYPEGVVCESNTQPIILLKNYGLDNLTSVTIHYQIEGGTLQSYEWTGNLAQGETESVTLPSIDLGTGQSTFIAFTSSPNGEEDENDINNQAQSEVILQTSTESLPFVENFETDVFDSNKWIIVNPDDGITWQRATVGGNTPGTHAAKMDFYNYDIPGQRDGMVSPRISLQGVSDATMTFEHAFRRYNQTYRDSLIIYVSPDCGVSWTRVFASAENGSGSFATQSTSTTPFTPGNGDWCFSSNVGAGCFSVDLTPFIGNNIFVKFEAYNAGTTGNNLYLDNINITGTPSDNLPIPDYTVNNDEICQGESVQFTDNSTENPSSWSWTFQGGTPETSTEQNPIVIYNNSGSYNITLEVTNENGTQSQTFTNVVTVHANPNITINSSINELCEDDDTEVTLIASGASSYEWSNGLGNDNPMVVNPEETTTYQVIGTSSEGCESTQSVTITVLPSPEVAIETSSEEICEGEDVELTASGANSYQWNNGLGGGAVKIVSPNETTTYTVTGNLNGCFKSISIEIVVITSPSVTITASNTTICNGEDVTLSAEGATNYQWSNNLGESNTINVTPTESTTYSVIGNNGECQGEASISIEVVPSPIISLSASNTSICEGDDVIITAEGATNYSWNDNLGDGDAITVSPTQTTTYSVVGNNGDCFSEASITIEVSPSLQIALFATDTVICEGSNVSITAEGATSYLWNDDLGENNSITVSPTETTTYSVIGDNGNCSGDASITIEVTSAPIVSISASNTAICEGESVVITVEGASEYQWNDEQGNENVITVSPTETTTYSVLGTNGNCTDEASITISVSPTPTVTLSTNYTTICEDETILITAEGADSYQWGNELGNDTSITVSPTESTTFSVVGFSGVCYDEATITIDVAPAPIVTISASSATICEGEEVVLTADGAVNYQWDDELESEYSITVSPTETTTYSVVGNTGNCSDTETITIEVLPAPEISLLANSTTICEGEDVTITAEGGISYQWENNLGNNNSIIASPTETTTYSVIGNDEVCSGSASITINVTPTPVITLTASNTSICVGEDVSISASGASGFEWEGNFGNDSTIIVSPTETTTYSVIGTSEECSSDITSITITVGDNIEVYLSSTSSSICAGEEVTLFAEGAGSFEWSIGEENGNELTVTPTETTTYQVTGFSGNCSDVTEITIEVNEVPNIEIEATSTAICLGDEITLSASGAESYEWDNDGETESEINVSPNESTNYTVTGSNENCSNTSSIIIHVSTIPEVIIHASSTSICEGETITMTAEGADSYVWSPANLLNTPMGDTVQSSPTSTTAFEVVGINNCGSSTESITVEVNSSPEITIEQDGNTLSVELEPGESAEWFFNNGSIGLGTSIIASQIGEYTVVVTNSFSCQASETINVTSIVNVDENEYSHSITLFPNPTTGKVELTWSANQTIQYLIVYDVIGNVIIKQNINTSTHSFTIDLSRFETGIYLFKVAVNDGKWIVRKITKH